MRLTNKSTIIKIKTENFHKMYWGWFLSVILVLRLKLMIIIICPLKMVENL